MNTKKILFAVAAFGMLALATYVPIDNKNDSNSIDKAKARTHNDARC